MTKRWNLHTFDDGDEGAAGAANNAGNNAGSNTGNSGAQGYSFEQAEEIANARADRAAKAALKSYFAQQGMTEEQISAAINDYKEKQAANKPNVSEIERERDEARAKLTAYEQANTLRKQGVPEDFLEFVAYKVAPMVTEELPFEKAAEQYLKDNPNFTGQKPAAGAARMKVSTGSDSAAGAAGKKPSMNEAIRRAAGY